MIGLSTHKHIAQACWEVFIVGIMMKLYFPSWVWLRWFEPENPELRKELHLGIKLIDPVWCCLFCRVLHCDECGVLGWVLPRHRVSSVIRFTRLRFFSHEQRSLFFFLSTAPVSFLLSLRRRHSASSVIVTRKIKNLISVFKNVLCVSFLGHIVVLNIKIFQGVVLRWAIPGL